MGENFDNIVKEGKKIKEQFVAICKFGDINRCIFPYWAVFHLTVGCLVMHKISLLLRPPVEGR